MSCGFLLAIAWVDPSTPFTVLQPDITFFGEKLTTEFEDALLADREVVDLLLVIGTSLKVAPVSDTLSA
jgi:NAD-dependent SIR2 family protein deacetylase